jgi:hypothetical protein
VKKRLPSALALAGCVFLALVATGGAARSPFVLDQSGIGRATLGHDSASYASSFGPGERERLGDGLDRIVFQSRAVAVIVRVATDRAIAIVTWSSQHTTAARIGPCSRTATLRHAYGPRLVTVASGAGVIALRLGRLVFVADPEGFVGSVMLAGDDVSPLLALELAACGHPSV